MKNIWQKTKKPILALAPMAGYTDPAFRIMCLTNGADIVYTEMVSVEAIWRKNKKTLNMLKTLPKEKNVILQLFGNKPESFAKALDVIGHSRFGVPQIGNDFCGIDINFGCPAHKVTKTGSGAALMDNKKLAREIIETVLKNTDLPVSIKIRSQVKNTTAIEFIEFIKDLPISAVMIHGRSLKQGFAGKVDFATIKKIKQLLPNKIILANGGINNSIDAQEMLDKTNADGLGIARGAWGRPWIFDDIKNSLTTPNKNYFALTRQNNFYSPLLEKDGNPANMSYIKTKHVQRVPPLFKGRWSTNFSFFKKKKNLLDGGVNKSKIKYILLQHAKLFLEQQKMCGYKQNLEPLRKHLLLYLKGQPHASELRQKIVNIKNLDELKKQLN